MSQAYKLQKNINLKLYIVCNIYYNYFSCDIGTVKHRLPTHI